MFGKIRFFGVLFLALSMSLRTSTVHATDVTWQDINNATDDVIDLWTDWTILSQIDTGELGGAYPIFTNYVAVVDVCCELAIDELNLAAEHLSAHDALVGVDDELAGIELNTATSFYLLGFYHYGLGVIADQDAWTYYNGI